jgi:hypothetical protein
LLDPGRVAGYTYQPRAAETSSSYSGQRPPALEMLGTGILRIHMHTHCMYETVRLAMRRYSVRVRYIASCYLGGRRGSLRCSLAGMHDDTAPVNAYPPAVRARLLTACCNSQQLPPSLTAARAPCMDRLYIPALDRG